MHRKDLSLKNLKMNPKRPKGMLNVRSTSNQSQTIDTSAKEMDPYVLLSQGHTSNTHSKCKYGFQQPPEVGKIRIISKKREPVKSQPNIHASRCHGRFRDRSDKSEEKS